MDDIIIRDADEKDIPDINRILNDIILKYNYNVSHHPKTLSDTKKWFDEHHNSERYKILIAEYQNQFAGWVSLSPFRMNEGYNTTAELSVYIDQKFYRKGIASRLMKEIELYVIKSGFIHCIISVITADNQISIDLHKIHGYEISGTFRELAQKSGKYVDIVMMTKLF